jgi:Tfp pilus assembly protein PilV
MDRAASERGFTIPEVLIAALIGVFVLGAISSLYVAAVRALDASSSQAALQRAGMIAVQVIAQQAARASSNPSTPPDASCIPSGTAGTTLLVRVTDTVPSSIPADQRGTYCYYAGNSNTAASPAGAFCQRVIPDSTGVPGPCWDLLTAGQAGLTHLPGQTGDRSSAPVTSRVSLIQQPDPFCPKNFDGTVIASASNTYCLALALNAGTQQTGDMAFAITDGMSRLTFTSSLMLLNHP